MQCDEVARLLPEAVESSQPVDQSIQVHIDTCLRCQAEFARYRKMLRGLHMLRTRYLEPSPGVLAQTLAELEAAARAVVKIETATEPQFQALFVAAMAFPHATAPSPHLGAVVTLPERTSSVDAAGGRRRRRQENRS